MEQRASARYRASRMELLAMALKGCCTLGFGNTSAPSPRERQASSHHTLAWSAKAPEGDGTETSDEMRHQLPLSLSLEQGMVET